MFEFVKERCQNKYRQKNSGEKRRERKNICNTLRHNYFKYQDNGTFRPFYTFNDIIWSIQRYMRNLENVINL
jgi:hypothetical protein